MRWFLGIVNTVALILILLCTSIQIPTFSLSFYSYEYDKHGVVEAIGVDKSELMNVTKRLQDYMRGKAPDLTVYASVMGTDREFFNEKEKAHMADVLDLFITGFKMRNIAVIIFLLSLLLLALPFKGNVSVEKAAEAAARAYRVCIPIFLLTVGILAAVIAVDFDSAFNMFHKIFFTNDLWQLDPAVDLLINIVPLGFFMDIAALIAVIFLLSLLAVWSVGFVYLRMRKKKDKHGF